MFSSHSAKEAASPGKESSSSPQSSPAGRSEMQASESQAHWLRMTPQPGLLCMPGSLIFGRLRQENFNFISKINK